MGLRPSELVTGIEAYSPPGPDFPIDLKLDGNEGRAPGEDLVEEVVRAWPGIARSYPDARPLRGEIARMIGVDAGRVIVTAGGDDAIERAVRCMLGPGREIVLPVPTFEMIERYAALAGGSVACVEWQDGPYPVDRVLAAVTGRTGVVTVVSPNSPTGLVATAQDIRRLSAGAPDALVLVDLAYVEFADEDPTGEVLGLPNAVVMRSMSKAWGLAGLRVGWAAGPSEVIGWMRAAGHPYAVSAPSLALAEARLRTGGDDVRRFAERIREERDIITQRLRSLGARVPDSQANFVLARVDDASHVWRELARRGIGVRIFPGKAHLEGCLRITLPGDEAAFERLVRALGEVLDAREVSP